MMKSLIGTLVLMGMFCGIAAAAERFGRIYDVTGDAALVRNGKREPLTRAKHLLAPLQDGDELLVSGGGRLLIVSAKSKKGYELQSGTTAKIAGGELKKMSGAIKQLDGLHVSPSEQDLKGRPGVLVMRGARQCLKIESPRDDSLVSTSVTLRWSIKCAEMPKVKIEVREDTVAAATRKPLFSKEAAGESLELPPGLLKHGTNYQWTLDGGEETSKSTGYFTIFDEPTSKSLKSEISRLKNYGEDVSQQLSLIFFLQENGMQGMADEEIAKLKARQEVNPFINELLK